MFNSIRVSAIDAQCLDYLAQICRSRGQCSHGVYVHRGGGTLKPRTIAILAILGGLAILLAAVLASVVIEYDELRFSPARVGGLQALLLLPGMAMVVGGTLALRIRFRPTLGTFWWVDGEYFWDVTPGDVRYFRLAEYPTVRCAHIHHGQVYSYSDLTFSGLHGRQQIRVIHKPVAERITKFAAALQLLSQHQSPPPAHLRAALALALLQSPANSQLAMETLGNLRAGLPIPDLRTPPDADESRPLPRAIGFAVAVGLAAFAVGYFALPRINAWRYERDMFAQTDNVSAGNIEPFRDYLSKFPQGQHRDAVIDRFEANLNAYAKASPPGEGGRFARYLSEFPNGPNASRLRDLQEKNYYQYALSAEPGEASRFRNYLAEFPGHRRAASVRAAFEGNFAKHAIDVRTVDACRRYIQLFPQGEHFEEIRELLDDCRFEAASNLAGRDQNPELLRQYLQEDGNLKHRDEAQQLLNAIYDSVLDQLRSRQPASAEDTKVHEATLALVDAMRFAPSPDVSISFTSSLEDQPETPSATEAEQQAHSAYLKLSPDLASLAERQGSAILGRGDVFSPVQIRRREKLIMSQLREAVGKLTKPEILQLVADESDASARIEVDYQTFTPGRLYAYTRTQTRLGPNVEEAPQIEFVGLLRGYHIKWNIRVIPPAEREPRTFTFTSNPAQSMRYDQRPGDPAWAPYAILLYSAFHDMSNRFVRSFAMDPGPAPEKYRFGEATGIDTYSFADLASVVRGLGPQLQPMVKDTEDWESLRTLVERSGHPFTYGTPSDSRANLRELEGILDRHPAASRVAMYFLEKHLESKPAHANDANVLSPRIITPNEQVGEGVGRYQRSPGSVPGGRFRRRR